MVLGQTRRVARCALPRTVVEVLSEVHRHPPGLTPVLLFHPATPSSSIGRAETVGRYIGSLLDCSSPCGRTHIPLPHLGPDTFRPRLGRKSDG